MHETYTFVFTILDFDQQGEEHKLTTHSFTALEPGAALKKAIARLIEFATRMVRCSPGEFAAKRLHIKSAWRDNGKKTRVTSREFLLAICQDTAPSGRAVGHVAQTPRKLPDVVRDRRHRKH